MRHLHRGIDARRGRSETRYIPAPLEEMYQQAWAVFPAMLKEPIDPPAG